MCVLFEEEKRVHVWEVTKKDIWNIRMMLPVYKNIRKAMYYRSLSLSTPGDCSTRGLVIIVQWSLNKQGSKVMGGHVVRGGVCGMVTPEDYSTRKDVYYRSPEDD